MELQLHFPWKISIAHAWEALIAARCNKLLTVWEEMKEFELKKDAKTRLIKNH